MIRSFIAGALMAGMLTTGAAYAQGRGPGGPGSPAIGRGTMRGLPLGSLNLTQAQQDLIRDIRQRHREEARQIETRLREAQEAQRKAVSAIPLNESQIRAATLALAEVQAELAVQQGRVQNEIFAALTPEQQAQVRQAIADREQRVAERRAQAQQRLQRQERRSR